MEWEAVRQAAAAVCFNREFFGAVTGSLKTLSPVYFSFFFYSLLLSLSVVCLFTAEAELCWEVNRALDTKAENKRVHLVALTLSSLLPGVAPQCVHGYLGFARQAQ